MHYIDDIVIQDIQRKANAKFLELVEELVGRKLKKKGGHYECITPFKSEKTPSFKVNIERKTWYCFSTSQGGYLAKLVELQVPEVNGWLGAMHWLADKLEIDTQPNISDEERAEREAKAKQTKRLYEAMAFAEKWYVGRWNPGLAEALLYPRALSEADAIDWSIGYAADSWHAFQYAATQEGFSPDELLAAGLLKKGEKGLYDTFRNRMLFTIHDAKGKPVAFGGRSLSDDKEIAKYINTGEGALYKKSELLYGWHHAKAAVASQNMVYWTEGYTDVIAMHRDGLINTVASCGTAITEAQMKLVAVRASQVCFVMDGDEAGLKAARKGVELALRMGLEPFVCVMPDGEDPDSYLKTHEDGALLKYVEMRKRSWLVWLVEYCLAQEEDTPMGKQRATNAVGSAIRGCPYPVARAEFSIEGAGLMRIDEEVFSSIVEGKEVATPGTGLDLDNFGDVLRLFTQLQIPMPPEFTAGQGGALHVRYMGLRGKPITMSVQGNVTQHVNVTRTGGDGMLMLGPYIPQRILEEDRPPETSEYTLYVTDHEVTAEILSSMDLHAVAFYKRDGFRSTPRGKRLNSTFELLAKRYQRIIYIVPGLAWQLPEVDVQAGTATYEQHDAAELSVDYMMAARLFLGAVRESKKLAAVPYLLTLKKARPSREWLLQLIKENPDKVYDQLSHAIYDRPDVEEFEQLDGAFAVNADVERYFSVDSAQSFYNRHTIQRLGSIFKFRGGTYIVDQQTNTVTEQKSEDELESIRVKGGAYYSISDKGLKRISNFTMRIVLKVTHGDESFYLLEFFNARDPERDFQQRVEVTLFTERTKFIKRISGIPHANLIFTGSSQDLLDVYKHISNNNPREAENMSDQLGWSGSYGFEIKGNGVVKQDSTFVPANEDGCLSIGDNTYFFPAVSSYMQSVDHAGQYRDALDYSYRVSSATWKEFIDLYVQTTGHQGHMAMAFTIKSLYRDILMPSTNNRDPHFFLLGQKGSGKGVITDPIIAMFGKLRIMNLGESPTDPAYRDHFGLYNNALAIWNEVNPSSIPRWMISGFKGPYDNQLRAKKDRSSGWKKTDYGRVSSSSILMGQETTIFQQEAVAERMVIKDVVKKARTAAQKQPFHKLNRLIKDPALSHLTAQFYPHRPLMEEKLGDKLIHIENTLRERCTRREDMRGQAASDRLYFNYAISITPLILLLEQNLLYYPLSIDEILADAADSLTAHHHNMNKEGVNQIFFHEYLQGYFGRKASYAPDDEVVFVHKGQLRIRFKLVYPLFAKFMQERYPGIENVSIRDMKRRLEEDKAYQKSGPVDFGPKKYSYSDGRKYIDSHDSSQQVHRAMCFDIEEIGIELDMPSYNNLATIEKSNQHESATTTT